MNRASRACGAGVSPAEVCGAGVSPAGSPAADPCSRDGCTTIIHQQAPLVAGYPLGAAFLCRVPLVAGYPPGAPVLRSSRAGISLLEVLISMFVLMVGLLGMAALMPVGRQDVARGISADRAAAVQSFAFSDARTRGVLKPVVNTSLGPVSSWLRLDNSAFTPTRAPTCVIDPIGLTANADTYPSGTHFTEFPSMVSQVSGTSVTMPRLTLRGAPVATAGKITRIFADRLFRCEDDLVVPRTGNASNPPTQQYLTASGTPLTRASNGDFSWMIMLVPQTSDWKGNFDVSVVVFQRRAPVFVNGTGTTPATAASSDPERMVKITDAGGGTFTGPGEAQLRIQPVAANKYTLPGYLNLRVGHWLLVVGNKVHAAGSPATYPTGTVWIQKIARWYRISAAERWDPAQNVPTRYVTLDGPEWDAGTNTATIEAALVDNVVAVYTRTMQLEQP